MLISSAHAQAPSSSPGFMSGEGLMGMLPIILMFALLYFLMIRPQMKRQKELKAMTDALQKGDEVVTSRFMNGVPPPPFWKMALRMKKLSNDICDKLGGRTIHPNRLVPGGFTTGNCFKSSGSPHTTSLLMWM